MMDSQLEYDVRIARYEERNARINADGWRRPVPTQRAIREAIAAGLIALALRLAPSAGHAVSPALPLANGARA